MHRTILPVVACALALGAAPALADRDRDHDRFSASLVGFEEVPLAIHSGGTGTLQLDLDRNAQVLSFTLEFSGLTSNVAQSHIHFGKRHVAGSVVVFFCSNLGNGPAGTQPCPAAGGTVTGTITAANVLGVPGQNVTAADFNAIVDALDSDTAYANVHTTNFPAGEIRGQIRRRHHGKNDRD